MFWGEGRNRDFLNENRELRKRIQALEEENSHLKFKLHEFYEKIFGRIKKKKKNRKDDDQDSDNKPEPRKPGAPKSHLGWFRKKPNHIDYIKEVSLKKCPGCGSNELRDLGKVQDHIQEDIIIMPGQRQPVTRSVNITVWNAVIRSKAGGRQRILKNETLLTYFKNSFSATTNRMP